MGLTERCTAIGLSSGTISEWVYRIENLQTQLVEAQAHIEQLRRAVMDVFNYASFYNPAEELTSICTTALAIQSDTEALRKHDAELIQRCISALEYAGPKEYPLKLITDSTVLVIQSIADELGKS